MFLQTSTYSVKDALSVKISLTKPKYTYLGNGDYRFKILKWSATSLGTDAGDGSSIITTYGSLSVNTDAGSAYSSISWWSASSLSTDASSTQAPILGMSSASTLTDTASSYVPFTLSQNNSSYSLNLASSNSGSTVLQVTALAYTNAGNYGYGYAMVDGSTAYGTTTTVNTTAVGAVYVTGRLDNAEAGQQITNLVYYYANGSTNYLKKVKYIDFWYSTNNSTWTLLQTFNTTAPTATGPTQETLTLTTPKTLLGGGLDYIKLQIRTDWGDPYGYIYCAEIRIYATSPLS